MVTRLWIGVTKYLSDEKTQGAFKNKKFRQLGLYKRSTVCGGACEVRNLTQRTDNCRIFYPTNSKIQKAGAVI